MCHVLHVHRSGFYAWLKKPVSEAEQDNIQLLQRIKESYVQSRWCVWKSENYA